MSKLSAYYYALKVSVYFLFFFAVQFIYDIIFAEEIC